MPPRSMIRSLTDTSSASSGSAQTPVLPHRASSRQASPQPDVLSLSPLSLTKQITRSSTRGQADEDLDEVGYMYSLRVALLQQRLDQASKHAPLTPPLSSPSFLDSPPDSPRSSARDSPPPMSKRKSAFGLNKKTPDELKLPKELLVEFWNVLETEHGNAGWAAIVSAFLKQVKKGTKTPSGMNLRHIPVLLDAFSQVASTEPKAQSMHEHQSHLVQLLYNFLPRSSFFSPLARSQSEKDKDLLFRLRAEVQSYMGSQDSTRSSMAPSSVHLSPSLSADRRSQHSVSSAKSIDYVAMVSDVWGVPYEVMARDVARVGELGPLEKIYMLDLKKTLSVTADPYNALDKARLASASKQLADLLARFPQLARSKSETLPPTPSYESSASQFVPADRVKVYHALRSRASGRGEELVDACRQIWMIPTRQELEMEIASLHRVWLQSVGSRDEIEIATSLAPLVQDLVDDLQGRPSPVLQSLQVDLYDVLEKSIDTIFPIADIPPARPPPSMLFLFAVGRDYFFSAGAKDLDDNRDRLKGAAVQEYVVAAQAMMEPHGAVSDARLVNAYVKIASWLEREIANIKKSWGSGLGESSALNPAAVVLGRQLPLFCAELGTLDKPQTSPEMFVLYDSVSRLVDFWQDLCPGQELGFELHSFFEPHVKAWLRQTDTHAVQDCVSRAVGMDNWRPQGEALHSQSVTDLFQFIHASLKTIQEELPLSTYRRGVYLTDLSKIISAAISQYATTVNALFMAEVAPPKVATPTMELQAKLGGKAGSWLAKGQQAVKSLEKKKIEGFVVPATACTKLIDMRESQASLQGIIASVNVPKTSQMKSLANDRKDGVQTVSITIMRGSGLLSKGAAKGADAFVVVDHQEASSRLWKTQTVLGSENPRWDETFELAINKFAHLNISAYDRQLVGKHTLIGSAILKLDKQSFASSSSRDENITLNPRGAVQLRLGTDSQGDGDAQRHLSSAMRALERTEKDMFAEIVDRIGETVKQVLSRHTLDNLGKLVKDKKRPKGALSDGELEYSLGSLFECLNANFLVFSSTLDPATRMPLMVAVWHRCLEALVSLLVPPLSDQPSTSRIPSSFDIEIVFKWLQLVKAFCNASEGDGTEHGIPVAQLQDARYRDLLMLGQYLDLPSPALKDRCATAVKSATSVTEGTGARNEDAVRTAEVLLRLARTRPDLGAFLSQQVSLLARGRAH